MYWTKQSSHITQKQSNISPTYSDPPLENVRHTKVEVEISSTERSPKYFSKRPMCWTMHLVKLKIPNNGHMPAAPEDGCKIYGSESRLTKQCWEGQLWQDKDKICRISERYVDCGHEVGGPVRDLSWPEQGVWRLRQVHMPGNPGGIRHGSSIPLHPTGILW